MKIPALKARIGNWDYYITTLTFEQVSQFVSKIDDQLHKSESLKDLIQRSVTSNYLSIKDYVLNQPELFFNSLVLAVYDDYPDWREIEFKYDNSESYQMGILEFPGHHKVFPVDGQHRVEGIKAALLENPDLKTQMIGAIFIGHSTSKEGMQRSRRLFSTLNRYAKPVTMDDIIALDEDDSIAIVTRILLEEHLLFMNNKVTKSKNKAIANDDKQSFTSIITLYDCGWELMKFFRKKRKSESPDADRDKKSIVEYLKFRPSDEEISLFQNFCFEFWNSFKDKFNVIEDFLASNELTPALKFRNSETGGNLLFRPVGLYPLVQAALEVHRRTENSFDDIFSRFNQIDLSVNKKPWKQVLWNSYENTMIMGSQGTTKLLLLYLYQGVIRPTELKNLRIKYAAAINYTENIEGVLETIENVD
jgi:DNA sulfur modification protein DndB